MKIRQLIASSGDKIDFGPKPHTESNYVMLSGLRVTLRPDLGAEHFLNAPPKKGRQGFMFMNTLHLVRTDDGYGAPINRIAAPYPSSVRTKWRVFMNINP